MAVIVGGAVTFLIFGHPPRLSRARVVDSFHGIQRVIPTFFVKLQKHNSASLRQLLQSLLYPLNTINRPRQRCRLSQEVPVQLCELHRVDKLIRLLRVHMLLQRRT